MIRAIALMLIVISALLAPSMVAAQGPRFSATGDGVHTVVNVDGNTSASVTFTRGGVASGMIKSTVNGLEFWANSTTLVARIEGNTFRILGNLVVDGTITPVVAGPVGPQGQIGLTGAQGVIGAAGPPGTQGLPGAQGAQGIQGVVGAAGPSGPVGAVGPIGPVGPTGLAPCVVNAAVPGAYLCPPLTVQGNLRVTGDAQVDGNIGAKYQ